MRFLSTTLVGLLLGSAGVLADFPATLERECASLPAGYRRGVFDAHAVIYNSHGTIIDVAVLF